MKNFNHNLITIKKNIFKILQNEYRKRYFFSINYYEMLKINQLFHLETNSNKIYPIMHKLKELRYESDKKEYIYPFFFKSSIQRIILKELILYQTNNLFINIFPNYFCLNKGNSICMKNYISAKKNYYKNLENKNNIINNKLFKNKEEKYQEYSFINLINDNENKDKSKYTNNNDNIEEKKEEESQKSLLLLIKRMSRNKDEDKYNMIKELFKINKLNFNDKKNKEKIIKKYSSPDIPLFSFNKRISQFKTEKNIKKLKNSKSIQIEEDKLEINKNIIYKYSKFNKSRKIKLIKDKNKYNNKFIPTFVFEKAIIQKKKKMENIYKLWNNCNLNVKYDNNLKKNKITIKGNNINILSIEDNNNFGKYISKKCEKELNNIESNYYNDLDINKNLMKKNIANYILRLTSKNLFNVQLYPIIDNKKYNLCQNNKKSNKKKLTKNLSYNNMQHYLISKKENNTIKIKLRNFS